MTQPELNSILFGHSTSVRRTARHVYFSFHYQRDVQRAQVVIRHGLTKGGQKAAGFFNGSLEEEAKTKGQAAVQKLIDDGMVGSTVTCVLIGAETYTRHWCDYEILHSVERGMGVFGVRVHGIEGFDGKADSPGPSPFDYLRYDGGFFADTLQPEIYYAEKGWQAAPWNTPVSHDAAPYLDRYLGSVKLSEIFRVYDWVDDNGYSDFSNWVETAAKQAGK